MDAAQTEADYLAAAQSFSCIQEHRDAAALERECIEKAQETAERLIEQLRTAQLEKSYQKAAQLMQEHQYKKAAELFATVREYRDAAELERSCIETSNRIREEMHKKGLYISAMQHMEKGVVSSYEKAIETLETIRDWGDAEQQIAICQAKISEAKKIEKLRQEKAHALAQKQKRQKKVKKAISVIAVVLVICFSILLFTVIIPAVKYNKAVELMENGTLNEAYSIFIELEDYKDSLDKAVALKKRNA